MAAPNGGGVTPAGANTSRPTGRRGQQLQALDDLSWNHGRHTLQVGANYRANKVTDTSIAAGSVIGTYTFSDLTDFAVGIVNSTNTGSKFSQSFPLLQAAHIAFYSIDFYAQDEWNVRKGLKITYGVRFERNGNPNCKENCLDRFNSTFLGSGYQAGAAVPYNSTIVSGLHNTFQSVEGLVSEPRLGVVFTPFGQGKTVFRAGVGLFANAFAGNVSANISLPRITLRRAFSSCAARCETAVAVSDTGILLWGWRGRCEWDGLRTSQRSLLAASFWLGSYCRNSAGRPVNRSIRFAIGG